MLFKFEILIIILDPSMVKNKGNVVKWVWNEVWNLPKIESQEKKIGDNYESKVEWIIPDTSLSLIKTFLC